MRTAGTGSIASAMLIAASAMMASAQAAESDFVARGNEPGWIVRKSAAALTFQTMGGDLVTIAPLPVPETAGGVETYRSTVGGQLFVLTVTQRLCVDSMSGMPHPMSVSVEIGRQRLDGCGGEPETLLHGEWSVDRIDGKPLVAGSQASMQFEPGGRVSGAASCNRYFAGLALTGETLTINKPGATMMACAPQLMAQERDFLTILEAVTRFEIGAGGSLVLHAKDGRSIAASRKG